MDQVRLWLRAGHVRIYYRDESHQGKIEVTGSKRLSSLLSEIFFSLLFSLSVTLYFVEESNSDQALSDILELQVLMRGLLFQPVPTVLRTKFQQKTT